MNREQKAATIDALADELSAAEAVIALDYRGLKVADAGELRAKLRQNDTQFRIVKNSLTERAADQAGVAGLEPMLQGPTALALVKGDPAAAAKTLADTARAIQLLPFKGAIVGSQALTPDQLTALSRLPTREVLYGQLVGVVASPISGLARTLGSLIGGLAVALGQVRDARPAQAQPAESPAPVEPAAEQSDSETEQPAAEQQSSEQEQPAAQAPADEAEDNQQQQAPVEAPAEAQPATSEEN